MTLSAPYTFDDAAFALIDMKPRVRVPVVAKLSDLRPRHITNLAAKGKIPGAAKHGGVWTFDQDPLARWLKEGTKWQTTSTSQKIAKLLLPYLDRRKRIPRVA